MCLLKRGNLPRPLVENRLGVFNLTMPGWVKTERSRLMATTDGSTWAELGKAPSTAKGLWFSELRPILLKRVEICCFRGFLPATKPSTPSFSDGQLKKAILV